MGKHYLIEHVTDYYNQAEERRGFELFISEIMRSATNSLADLLGGSRFPHSWKELMENKPETRTADEIKDDITNKLHALGGE